MLRNFHAVVILLLLPLLTCPQAFGQAVEVQDRLPSGAVEGLDVADGLEATLFAAEPMLVNPTNMDIDARGRVWVIEGYNYRLAINPHNPVREAGDRIVILEDTDGDGVADQEKTFYQGPDINAALGIAVLGEKVIVSSYTNVFVFTDADGDDRPDEKEVLFTGFLPEESDHAVHAFVFGPDGKVYFNFGNAGGLVRDRVGNVVIDEAGNPVIADGDPYHEGMVFRTNIDGSAFEVLGHNFRNPYEVAVDSYGSLWQSDNDDDGNRAVRINFLMEGGNYGRADEMTGANWREHRTGLEEEIPMRHWHQNDPGVVPNLLITGAGSPTGIVVYEGRLLPPVYWDEMIHADAGPNVVRAYPTERSGAGYSAEIVDVVNARDRWFRPSDVTVAPDGSLFIADWYDPGVGGHQVGDLERGRIFRIAPPDTPYRSGAIDLSSPESAVDVLESPNLARRYLAWQQLHAWGVKAEPALNALWASENQRFRARALWLLSKIDGRGTHYVDEALKDENPDIRITGLRAARQLEGVDVFTYVRSLVGDASPQVRREAALALRHEPSLEAAELWAELALQHDPNDRWYLEALGIGADGQWDRFFAAWKERVGQDWDTPAGRDIIWRARSKEALPLLTEIIRNTETAPQERYFRAFDFHTDPSKQRLLVSLAEGDHPDQPEIRRLALHHLGPDAVTAEPSVRQALEKVLSQVEGTQEYVELVSQYGLRDRNETLLQLALTYPDSSLGINAGRVLMEVDGFPLLQETALAGDNEQTALAAVKVLGHLGGPDVETLLEQIMADGSRNLAVRRAAVESYGRGWDGEDRLLEMVKTEELPEQLKPTAAGSLMRAYREGIRNEAARHLKLPLPEGSKSLPPIDVLVARDGMASRGKEVFTHACGSCHQVNGAGTDFGPDLSEIGGKLSKESLYTSIVHPDAGISFGYEGYHIRLNDGTGVVGFIASETKNDLVVRTPDGLTTRYRKTDVASRVPLESSLMPSGLHQALTERQLVDLIEYLASLKPEEQ